VGEGWFLIRNIKGKGFVCVQTKRRFVRDWSLFRGGGGLVQIGGVNDFYAGKKGGDINLCMHIREL